jgi:molybdenum cofactor biosynthesis enzyme MoaA
MKPIQEQIKWPVNTAEQEEAARQYIEDVYGIEREYVLPYQWDSTFLPGDESLPTITEIAPDGYPWKVGVRQSGERIQPRKFYELDGKLYLVNANGNIVIHPTAICNAKCPTCSMLADDLGPDNQNGYYNGVSTIADLASKTGIHTVSITGGEPTLNPRRLLSTIDYLKQVKRDDETPVFDMIAMHTQGTGFFREAEGHGGYALASVLGATGLSHVSISRNAHEQGLNDSFMKMKHGLDDKQLAEGIKMLQDDGVNVRLSSMVVRGITDFEKYLPFARKMAVNKVIFRIIYPLRLTDLEADQAYESHRISLDETTEMLNAVDGTVYKSAYDGNVVSRRDFDYDGMNVEVEFDRNPPDEYRSIKTIIVDAKGKIKYSWADPTAIMRGTPSLAAPRNSLSLLLPHI